MKLPAKYLADGDEISAEDDQEDGPADPGTDPWMNQQLGQPDNPGLGYIPVQQQGYLPTGGNIPDDTAGPMDVAPYMPEDQVATTPAPSPDAKEPPVAPLMGALETLRQGYAKAPLQKPAKWWEKGAAATVGGLAGWSNAASRMKQPINAAPAEENLLHPGYNTSLSEWQNRVIAPAEKQVEILGQQVQAQYGGMKAQSEAQLRAAQAQMNLDRAKYYSNLAGQNRTAPVVVTPELAAASGNLFHAGQSIPAATASQLAIIAAGKYDPKYQSLGPNEKYAELMKIPGMTPEMARLGAVNPTAVAKPTPNVSEWQSYLDSNGGDSKKALAAKQADEIARAKQSRDPMSDVFRQDMMDRRKQTDLQNLGNWKINQEKAITDKRDQQLAQLHTQTYNGDLAADTGRINSEAVNQLQAVQNQFAQQGRAKGVQTDDYDVAVDPQGNIRYAPRPVGGPRRNPYTPAPVNPYRQQIGQ
jgi:hypothetical protein